MKKHELQIIGDYFFDREIINEDEIKKIFLKAGFSQVDAYSPLSFDSPKDDDMRIVFVAK